MVRKSIRRYIQQVKPDVVINANDHIMGRLAATVAKHLLRGERVTVVRCEGLVMSGPFRRNKLKFVRWFHKRHVTNPKRGPFHYRAPSLVFARVVRGMIPYKTKRGAWCMRRLIALDGCPPPYDKMKAFVCPRALRRLRLDPTRKWCRLGRICSELGWKYADVVNKLEEKRKARNSEYHAKRVRKIQILKEAQARADEIAKKQLRQVRS